MFRSKVLFLSMASGLVSALVTGGSARASGLAETQPGGLFCLADCNRDLAVDASDIGVFLADWGGTQFDFNHSGATDGGDLGTLISQWGQTCHSFHDNVSIAIDDDRLIVTGNGMPDHEAGAFPGECGNPNAIGAQNDSWMLPITPAPTANPAVDSLVQMGPIGVMVNGVAFYNPYDGGGVEAPGTICMDSCNAHPSPDARYHYHQYSPCIEPESGGHSSLIGYAFDGFPVYGPWEEDDTLAAEIEGKRALDQCNGHFDAERGYHYHAISLDLAVERGLPGDGFPWTIGCFAGEPDAANFSGGGGGGGGGDCNGCMQAMIPPPVCNCLQNTPGYEYCCQNWDAACQAAAAQFCGG